MGHWDLDEVAAVPRRRKMQRAADRAQALGLARTPGRTERASVRIRLGRAPVAPGMRLQGAGRVCPDLRKSPQCGAR